MSIEQQVERGAAIPHSAYSIVSLDEAMNMSSGIVFIFAEWSGDAIRAWRVLTKLLAPLLNLPPIRVVDADDLTPETTRALLDELPQGKGEIYWLKDGRVYAKQASLVESDSPKVMQHLRALLPPPDLPPPDSELPPTLHS